MDYAGSVAFAVAIVVLAVGALAWLMTLLARAVPLESFGCPVKPRCSRSRSSRSNRSPSPPPPAPDIRPPRQRQRSPDIQPPRWWDSGRWNEEDDESESKHNRKETCHPASAATPPPQQTPPQQTQQQRCNRSPSPSPSPPAPDIQPSRHHQPRHQSPDPQPVWWDSGMWNEDDESKHKHNRTCRPACTGSACVRLRDDEEEEKCRP